MKKYLMIMAILSAVLLLLNILFIGYVVKAKERNKNLAEEWSALNKITDHAPEKSGMRDQDAKKVDSILHELKYHSYVKRLEMNERRVQLRLEGISQEQLFTFLRRLSEKTEHRLLLCDISKHGSSIILIAEIQLA